MTRPRMHRPMAAAAICLGVLALAAGCSDGSSFADLEREPSADDALPMPESGLDGVDLGSVRYVGDHEGTEVWVARAADFRQDICLALMPSDGAWSVACGGVWLKTNGFVVQADGALADDDWVRVSHNVWAY
ncbi:hypothetical protein [Microbacterium halophytorum]|uniref:hypothetical protein n=1 Tax=Microbacterium halophytorum TaxID=2067568 RepID=UPI001319B923|nr:hypothetical protein [Microbacterium halophytorum]